MLLWTFIALLTMAPGQCQSASVNGALDDAAILEIIDPSCWCRNAGSALHGTGECKPCLFFHTRMGCMKGAECEFCHICHDPEVKIAYPIVVAGEDCEFCNLFDEPEVKVRQGSKSSDVTDTSNPSIATIMTDTLSPSVGSGATDLPSSFSSSVASGYCPEGLGPICVEPMSKQGPQKGKSRSSRLSSWIPSSLSRMVGQVKRR